MGTRTLRIALAVVTACALIAFGISSAVAQDAPNAASDQTADHAHHNHLSNTIAYDAALQGTPSISVADQPLTNNTLVVAEVVAMEDGWIAIHTVEANDKPVLNQIVGTAQVRSGTNTNVQVKLNESFQPGDRLQVMLHVDHGTKGTFEFPSGPDAAVRIGEQVLTKPISVLAADAQPQAMMPNTGQGNNSLSIVLVALLLIAAGLGAWHSSRRSGFLP
jgi:LPXTG-motif cell wall-anchored protein